MKSKEILSDGGRKTLSSTTFAANERKKVITDVKSLWKLIKQAVPEGLLWDNFEQNLVIEWWLVIHTASVYLRKLLSIPTSVDLFLYLDSSVKVGTLFFKICFLLLWHLYSNYSGKDCDVVKFNFCPLLPHFFQVKASFFIILFHMHALSNIMAYT